MRAFFERGRLSTKQVFAAVLDPLLTTLDIAVGDAEACLADMAQSGILRWVGRRGGMAESESDDDVPLAGAGRKRVRPCGENGGVEAMQVGRGHHRLVVGGPTQGNDEDVWDVCFVHLNREFRNECCALVVQGRVGSGLAVRVLRAGLQMALEEEDCESATDDFETCDVGTRAIQIRLEADQDGAISDQDFWAAVQALVSERPAFVIGIPENGPTKLRFVPGRLVSDARQKTVEDLVASRYGVVGRRVFRALGIGGGMEEKMVAERCMLPLKVTREHLFRMYQDRMVGMQEVPRSHDQTRASNWYYLWNVNPMAVYRGMMEIMYKTILNLVIRLQCVEERNVVTEMEREGKKKQREVIMASILRMDQSVMVMRDFGPVTSAYLPTLYTVIDGPQGRYKRKR